MLVQFNMSSEGTSPGASATVHLFAPVKAPCLTSISSNAIQDFLAGRKAYEDAVAAQPSLNPMCWRSSFPATFLRPLVRARMFGAGVTEVSQLSVDTINAKLESFAAWKEAV